MSNQDPANLFSAEQLTAELSLLDMNSLNREKCEDIRNSLDSLAEVALSADLSACADRCQLVANLIELACHSADEDTRQAEAMLDFVQANATLLLDEFGVGDCDQELLEQLVESARDQWGDYLAILENRVDESDWSPDDFHHDAPVEGKDTLDVANPNQIGQILSALAATQSDPELPDCTDDAEGPQNEASDLSRNEESDVEQFMQQSSIDLDARLDGELLEAFLDDSHRCLESMEQTVLAFESTPSNGQLLPQFCRDLHTLKGASASVGLEKLATYLHHVESTIEKDERDKSNETLMELLLGAVDAVREQMSVLAGQEPLDASGQQTELSHPKPNPGELRITDESSIRIRANKLDRLMDMLAELVVLRNRRENRLNEFSSLVRELSLCSTRLRYSEELPRFATVASDERYKAYSGSNTFSEVAKDLSEVAQGLTKLVKPFAQDNQAISQFIRHFRQEFMQLRRLPISGLFNRLQRAARDAAKAESKTVQVTLLGAETALDQELQERLYEPLLHIVRNAVSHGLEQDRRAIGKSEAGQITVEAKSSSNLLVIEVRDDGAGLDFEAVRRKAFDSGLLSSQYKASNQELAQLIFHPGFSTKQKASKVSGRGIGMDIVAEVVSKLQGRIEVDSITGDGTTMRLSIPLRSGIEHVMVFRVGAQLFAVPMQSVCGVKNSRAVNPNVNIRRLASVLDLQHSDQKDDEDVLLFNHDLGTATKSRFGIAVSEVLGPEEVVVRPLPVVLQRQPLFSGVVLSGSGQTVLLLETEQILKICQTVQSNLENHSVKHELESSSSKTALVVDDSLSARKSLVRIVQQLGFKTVEAGNGSLALDRLRSQSFDVVFSDLDMPVMGGLELLSEIQLGGYGATPVIVVSSRETEEFHNRAIESGAAGYVVKPAAEESICEVLNQLNLVNPFVEQ